MEMKHMISYSKNIILLSIKIEIVSGAQICKDMKPSGVYVKSYLRLKALLPSSEGCSVRRTEHKSFTGLMRI